jgi:hypothetical protein
MIQNQMHVSFVSSKLTGRKHLISAVFKIVVIRKRFLVEK